MTSQFLVQPCSPESALLVEGAEHVLLGLSPWNSYYKPATIDALVGWACSHFTKVDVFLPGYEAAHTLTAAGIDAPEAVRRARRAVTQLRNPARSALERAGVSPSKHLHTWTTLANRPSYVTARARVEDAYRDDPEVRRACRLTAREAVRHASGGHEPTDAQIDQAVSYAIAELPLVVNGPEVFGTKTSVFVYHRQMDLLAPLIAGKTIRLRPAKGQGYAVVTRAQNDPNTIGTATTDSVLPLRYPFPPGELGTPPPVLEWARKHRPVCPVQLPSGTEVWMVTRKNNIAQVLTDPRFSRNLVHKDAPRYVGEDFTAVPGCIFNLDPPDHTRVRHVISRFYTSAGAETYRPMVEQHAARLLDAMAEGPNPADLVPAYIAPLPLAASSAILRIPIEQVQAHRRCFHAQTNPAASPEQVAAATKAVTEFTSEVIEEKLRETTNADTAQGPIEALIQARAADLISEQELQGTVAYLLVIGSEPLVSPLGTGIATLLVNRDQLNACINDPTLWPKAVEEVLRYHHNGGVLGLPRVATEDITLHNVTIRRGQGVCTPMLSATWDPEHYQNPAKFNIHRGTDATAAFGAGPHFCLGTALTRMFLLTAYQALFAHFPTLFLAISEHEIPRELDLFFTGPASVPVVWNPAPN
ncbi:tRNA-dependent cyclodipeptide synthase [Mycobacterium montefiorense]|uniref:Cyclodipeptide synthase n=1 Tax=Mycobacterium montefiorense TaxID=154654 RepID=A0AA37PR96_9MYCO|nr:tRNA-dependent cyclodipeptide synthase [Mycobacterium montefiorense]GBG40587.1 hypothetical protein MmonteBS_49590 [Mycobacterium montefiorense]GKU33432.1 hypothetical protein NJB14191_07790 [Mycobacterium montefiorense]GKU39243.1 hypothetical protein NJB14192_12380 [Mycobacterium montefiorense]GKU44768.1 hypothetical protein NJB14194_13940 [Mycobacterium montefiorense]GKU53303.1 hypothetical protein NJB14195_45440 [Mycobacterium montefiorense]